MGFGLVWCGLVQYGMVWYGIGIGHIRLHSELYCPGTYILTFPGGWSGGWVVGHFGNKAYLKSFGLGFRSCNNLKLKDN